MKFKEFEELVDATNIRLGSFCNEFGSKRKELAKLGKSPKRGILFTFNKKNVGRDWAINEGGGTEIQYHIALDTNTLELRYGLGFNSQYVQFANDMSPVEYMRPFMNAFILNESKIRTLIPTYDFVIGNRNMLLNPSHDDYVLFGKKIKILKNNLEYSIDDIVFDEIIQDLKLQFLPYQIIFSGKNNSNKISMQNINLIDILTKKKQLILQGPPGTGKTFTAKDMAELLIYNEISSDKKVQKKRLEETDQFKLIQFHPAYSYEDFVRGITAKSTDNKIEYITENKVLAKFAKLAAENWKLSSSDTVKFVAIENWVQSTIDDFKEYLLNYLDENDEKLMITPKVYISRITDNSIRYNSDAWEVDGGVPVSDLLKMYLAGITQRREVKELATLTKTAKSLATYWFKILELFKKYIDDNKLKYDEVVSLSEEKKYILIIDEINRANLPAVLGELIYVLEYRGEKVESMYDIDEDNSLVIPPNLLIIGTMNTSDRSVGHIDYAIRRRFAFVDILPKILDDENFEADYFKKVSELFIANFDEYVENQEIILVKSQYLSEEFRPEDVWLGHSYFITKDIDFVTRLKYEIKPILKEYIKDGILKQSAETFINNLLL
ncbi:MAG TPA: AAA family ATPase [Flavobacterium sp.]|jgi:Cdc6-like AAA superfamily ATPase|uniref:AAA family ATPase n=1 Tax=Flavobacterium sp. TaxID=239 RepID=UPI0025BEF8B5|nr:AAA family ATPase [Flavobacterium sp.]HRM46024.1 AAA family ATPase [Flavobacterium sp.]